MMDTEMDNGMQCNVNMMTFKKMMFPMIVMITMMTMMKRGCDGNSVTENNQENDGRSNKVAIDPYDILYVLETLLCSFHTWYKCGG